MKKMKYFNLNDTKINFNKYFFTILFFTKAYASENDYSKQYSVCMDNSGGVTSNILECISSETSNQDNKLNKVYKDLILQLLPDRKKQLINAQRAWIKYRDLNCEFYIDPDGGTMESIISNNCYLDSIIQRSKELEILKERFTDK
jgi:uncharacterized protein YecT (DUF1311 family)